MILALWYVPLVYVRSVGTTANARLSSMNPVTTKSVTRSMPTRGLQSLTLPTHISRRGCSCSVMGRRTALPRDKRLCLRMCTLRPIKLQGQLGPQVRSGPARVQRRRSLRCWQVGQVDRQVLQTDGEHGSRRSTPLRSRPTHMLRSVINFAVARVAPFLGSPVLGRSSR